MKSFNWQSLYFYAVCFVCICAFIIVTFNLIDSIISVFIRIKGYNNSMMYNWRSILESVIYIAILVPIYLWHWHKAQALSNI
ncbi:DUF5671 domain-containing protein [Weissella paramesenteroides]|uniref:DUF5671 domain-containing protein n=1 Tax=Weissella paramesenteroides TaxID=1249 RepID=UPI003F74AAE2